MKLKSLAKRLVFSYEVVAHIKIIDISTSPKDRVCFIDAVVERTPAPVVMYTPYALSSGLHRRE